jgi:hypothetical protein
MDIIVRSQSHSFTAEMTSHGANPLSVGEMYESTLEELLDWLSAANGTASIDSTEEDIIISQRNNAGIETQRTTISCNPSDRQALLAALTLAPAYS